MTITSNAQPTANPQSVTTDEDTPLTITLTGSDAEDAALTFSIVTGPDHGTLVPNGAVDCSAANTCSAPMLYTPGANYHGPDSFTFTVNDGTIDSASALVSITVNSVNDPPVAVNDSFSTDEDTPLVLHRVLACWPTTPISTAAR